MSEITAIGIGTLSALASLVRPSGHITVLTGITSLSQFLPGRAALEFNANGHLQTTRFSKQCPERAYTMENELGVSFWARNGHFCLALRSREDAYVLLCDLAEVISRMRSYHLEHTTGAGRERAWIRAPVLRSVAYIRWSNSSQLAVQTQLREGILVSRAGRRPPPDQIVTAAPEILPTPANATSLEEILDPCILLTESKLAPIGGNSHTRFDE
ncbi:uncharacterized protein BO97DRAFT_420287 [Aspergillus homomorphus CBS 101889]|uniref:Uncharacterized protein n=1 Tax=Aspergillus homomorphus (strain CBS 101889) TaxID=1450537 RepID=A0A395I9K2_ASPHC|nr:hypothetical protein BO97DRAFT_420287 [Aspergillus homomorphus CBS 101889]RAL16902.1 hypothetical protein BO97DRAFT_420287 [Aspergillus homomorphus CBS 101889]